MSRAHVSTSVLAGVILVAVLATGTPVLGQGSRAPNLPKSGGILRMMHLEDLPQGFSIHETATVSTTYPAMACLSNLVLFDPLKRIESLDTVIGELAERWSWQDAHRSLVFFLRRDVRWHDGQPFTSKDVKYTFDVVREAPDAPAKFRINPRKDWYANVEAIEAPDPSTVVFRLKRPQPSLLMMLASGYSPIYPAHVPPAEFRTRCVGTGPFKLKEWKRGEFIEYVKNPEYFVKGRPYLDGIRYLIIGERGTRTAALQAGRLDAAFPGQGPKAIADQLKAAVPSMAITETMNNTNDNLLLNATRPPFNNVKLRLAFSRAVDRRAYIQAVAQGAGLVGGAMEPKPYGVWGLTDTEVVKLPGYGKPAAEKATARRLLAEAGYGPANPLRVEVATRATPNYIDFASFVLNELKQVGVEATIKQIDTAQWHALITRRDFQVGANVTGIGIDDPDANFYENYACGSPRNHTGYCSEELARLFDAQSTEIDPARRRELVARIQSRLEEEVARPVIAWRKDYFAHWPYVKNLVPHQVLYNWGRMQEVWLDR
jgi:peptide/nickel transport system substrate-binding protein